MTTTRMAVIGTGNMGSGLARALAAAGVEVVVGARDAGTAAALADAPGSVRVLDVAGAVAAADVVVLTLPYGASVQVLQGLPAAALQGKVLVDISNPVTADFQGLQLGTTTSAAEAIQAAAPGAQVVKAFNTIFAQLLAADARRGQAPVQVFVAGDDLDAKTRVQALARVLGFEPVDAGPLRNSRYLEPIGGMNIQFGFFLGWGRRQHLPGCACDHRQPDAHLPTHTRTCSMTHHPSRRGLAIVAAASMAAFLGMSPLLAHAAPASDDAAIRQTLQRYEEALNRGDTAAIVQLYTPDGVQLAPDAPAALGQEALKGAYAGTFKAIALKLAFTVDEIQLLGKDAALLRSHSVGTLKVQGNDQPCWAGGVQGAVRAAQAARWAMEVFALRLFGRACSALRHSTAFDALG